MLSSRVTPLHALNAAQAARLSEVPKSNDGHGHVGGAGHYGLRLGTRPAGEPRASPD